MNPERFLPAARIFAVVLVLGALIALAAWYFYIARAGDTIEETNAGRGLGGGIPSFEGSGGSTFGNLLGELPTEAKADETPRVRLSQVHAAPVSGFRLSSTTVQYMDRSGYLFSASLSKETVVRTTNTLIPRVAHTILGDEAFLGFAYDEGGDARAFVGVLEAATSSRTLPSIAIKDLGDTVVGASPAGETLLTLVSEPDGGGSLIESDYDGSSPRLLARSAIDGWTIESAGERVVLVERSASGVPSSAFEIRAGQFVPLINDTPGLSVRLGTDAYLYSTDAGTPALYAVSSTTRPLPLKTVADKCAWLPLAIENPLAFCAVPDAIESRTFLDDWYRGETRTRDSWWRIDATDGSTKEVFSSPDEGILLDAYNPQVDPSGSYIVFQNKYDETLWVLRINE